MVDVDVSLHEVAKMATSSLSIPPPDAFQRLGFCVRDEFLVSMCV